MLSLTKSFYVWNMIGYTLPSRILARYGHQGPLISAQEIPSILVLLLSSAVAAIGVLLGLLHYDAAKMNSLIGPLFYLWCCGLCLRWVGLKHLANALCLISLYYALAASITSASMALATSRMPYADSKLTSLDAALFGGFSWPIMIATLRPQHNLLRGLSYAYSTLEWQAPLLFACLCLMREANFAWRFFTAWSLALFATLAAFPFCPALGAFGHYNIQHSTLPDVLVSAAFRFQVNLTGLRDGTLNLLTPSNLAGIICMPSFHAAAAVLLAWGFWRVRLLRWPGLILNAVMFVSAVPIGGHYLVDVVAGAACAALAIAASGIDWRAKWAGRPKVPRVANFG